MGGGLLFLEALTGLDRFRPAPNGVALKSQETL